jgi:protein-tyrosine phosphatase
VSFSPGGFSRSPSVIIAYLIRFRGLTFDEALEAVRLQRGCANPNEGFTKQLREFEKQMRSR